jgi:EAL domain-containing protein (putative c-di-GMP-specific phosphodiesterase class I)
MQLYQLIYKSIACDDLNDDELESLCQTSIANNAAHEITGVLLFDGLNFLQVLEGRFTPLTQLMSIIEQDSRHQKIVTLIKEPIAKREFANWSMTLIKKDPKIFGSIEKEFQFLDNQIKKSHLSAKSESRSSMITQAFRDGAWSREVSKGILPFIRENNSAYQAGKKTGIETDHCFAFQPIIDVSSREVVWVEALLRGKNKESPYELFSGLALDKLHNLDAQSKLSALSVFAHFDAKCGLTLNLLPGTLIDFPSIIVELAKLADQLSIDREQIVIELTEQEAIENPHDIQKIVNDIKAKGFKLAIDDFGSGYAGLLILVELQPHIIKIDRGIVAGVAQSGPREAIIESIIYCAARLGITVIAEGIETREDFAWLLSAGIRHFQGYLLAKPEFMGLPEITLSKDW